MPSLLATVLCFLLALAPLAQGLHALKACRDTAGVIARMWQDEYALRRCASLAATRANLAAAGDFLVERKTEPFRAKRVADHLGDMVFAWYPGSPRSNADGICRGAPELHLATILHEQRLPGQPAHWPNWVPRFVPDDRVP